MNQSFFAFASSRAWIRLVAAGLAFSGAIVALVSGAPGCMKSDANLPVPPASPCPSCPPDPRRETSVAQCSITDSVERLPVESFNNRQINSTTLLDSGTAANVGAQDLYTYTDGTALLVVEDYNHLAVPLQQGTSDTGANPGSLIGISSFEPPVAPGSPCGPAPDGGSASFPGQLHIFNAFSGPLGGPFRAWGGGIGVPMAKLNGRDPTTVLTTDPTPSIDPDAPKSLCCCQFKNNMCNQRMDTTQPCTPHPDPRFAAVCPPADAEYAVAIGAIDVSHYEGLSFWARRGPSSQIGMRVLIGDKYTDDDINYLAQRGVLTTGIPQPLYCQRIKECDCRIGQTCTFYDSGLPLGQPPGNYCERPLVPPNPPSTGPINCALVGSGAAGGGTPINGQGSSNCCDVTGCAQVYAAFPGDTIPDAGRFVGHREMVGQQGDVQFFGKPCTPYTWPNGIGGSWCWDPATDPPPPASSELCGDHWTATVDLTPEWQFYMVPFTIMHQQGWAKRSEQLDLHAVSTIRFSWDAGNIDYWIDDVAFYRHKNR
ncbi:MAG: hypothetical protein JOZ69_08020 [Myxococcales bacterium]|nr:hypothetical protein [Myxococcales bacterium]